MKLWRGLPFKALLTAALALAFRPGVEAAAGVTTNTCAPCHREISEKYSRTAMGRSFYRPSPENMREVINYPGDSYHPPSDSYFTMLQRGSAYYQRRFQVDSRGKQVNVMEKRIDYILGSGNHSRAYLHRTAFNTLVELPLAWYAEKGGYRAMNPGYDRPDHEGFRRPITYDCLFCHNAYPRIPAANEHAFAPAVYEGPLPEGIDCQRCHGPGERHAKLAATTGSSLPAIRNAIVNPARLSGERQMEICMACHLETTSFPLPNAIQRYDRGPFSYLPGEPLASFLLNFDHAPGTGREGKFEIVNAAYRLRQSACFLKSNGKMLCTTCHNPHDAPSGDTGEQYSTICRQCHAPALRNQIAAGKHTQATSCIHCHMPKRRTEDVVHVVVTDHYIQRQPPAGDLLADRQERHETGANAYQGAVVPYYPKTLPSTPENELYLAVAQLKQGSNLNDGIARLTAALKKYSPVRTEFYLELADALERTGQPAKAVPFYRAAAQRNAKSAITMRKLGGALRRSGQYSEAAEVLKQAGSLAPGDALTWHELGLVYRALDRNPDAIMMLRKALDADPELPEAHNNLGIIWAMEGATARADSAFREAIRIRPDYADAHGNLANLLSSTLGSEAVEHFEKALRLRPNDAATRYNYAMQLGRGGHYDQAQHELETALRDDPEFSDAHQLLGELLLGKGQAKDAVPHFEAVVRSKPDAARAHLGMGSALATLGKPSSAIPHLQRSAASSDPGVREQATTLLRQLGTKP